MKTVQIRYFALFREQAGRDTETLQTVATSVGDLFSEVCAERGLSDSLPNIKVALNDELVDMSTAVADGDTVLFFPPVSGG